MDWSNKLWYSIRDKYFFLFLLLIYWYLPTENCECQWWPTRLLYIHIIISETFWRASGRESAQSTKHQIKLLTFLCASHTMVQVTKWRDGKLKSLLFIICMAQKISQGWSLIISQMFLHSILFYSKEFLHLSQDAQFLSNGGHHLFAKWPSHCWPYFCGVNSSHPVTDLIFPSKWTKEPAEYHKNWPNR